MGHMKSIEAVITTRQTVELSLDIVADWFCELSDDQQAEFFIAVAERGKKWTCDSKGFCLGANHQWWLIGRHLATCKCATEEARDMVCTIVEGIKADV